MKKFCLLALLLWTLAACKKEALVTDRGLKLDLSKYSRLSFDYTGRVKTLPAMRTEWQLQCNNTDPVWLSIGGGTPNPYIPPGFDTLRLVNIKTGKADFSGQFNIADSTDKLTFFQIDSSFRPVIVRNDQGNVTPPPADVIKMRLANFCSELGTEPIDMVVRQYSIFWEALRTDTIYNILPGFPSDYFSLQLAKYTSDWGDELYATPYVTFIKSADKSPIMLKQEAIPGYDLGIYLSGAGRVTTAYIYGTYKADEFGNVEETTGILPLFEN